MTQIFIPKEVNATEKRVAAIPDTVKKFVSAGFEVRVQAGAGESAFISDKDYEGAGASCGEDLDALYAAADIVLKVQPPMRHPERGRHEVEMMKEGTILITHLVPNADLDTIRLLMKHKVSCFSMNLIPRITIAQKMDSLSSQASIAGYKAVLMAASTLGKYFPLLMTAAGTITPAKVVVLGAGVAGLQAIATARRLGASVEVSDVRLAVKEQVESLGAKFIEVESEGDMEDAGGYAKEQSEEDLRRQREEVGKRMAQADVVITTALIPGRPAPLLITEETLNKMRPGSVIVDLAVEQGGNCEWSEAGKTVVKNGITIIGELNIPSTMPIHASQLYARNLLNLLLHLGKDGKLEIDVEEEITNGALLTHGGELRHEPTRKLLET